MIRNVAISLVLSAVLVYAVYRMADMFQGALPRQVTRVDIHASQIDYRSKSYPSPSLFAIGLKAAQDPPEILKLHDCSRMDTLEEVLGILREQGYATFEIQLPETC